MKAVGGYDDPEVAANVEREYKQAAGARTMEVVRLLTVVMVTSVFLGAVVYGAFVARLAVRAAEFGWMLGGKVL